MRVLKISGLTVAAVALSICIAHAETSKTVTLNATVTGSATIEIPNLTVNFPGPLTAVNINDGSVIGTSAAQAANADVQWFIEGAVASSAFKIKVSSVNFDTTKGNRPALKQGTDLIPFDVTATTCGTGAAMTFGSWSATGTNESAVIEGTAANDCSTTKGTITYKLVQPSTDIASSTSAYTDNVTFEIDQTG